MLNWASCSWHQISQIFFAFSIQFECSARLAAEVRVSSADVCLGLSCIAHMTMLRGLMKPIFSSSLLQWMCYCFCCKNCLKSLVLSFSGTNDS